MSDRLALAVGKIILAWGRLDQQFHLLIKMAERRLKLPHSNEGRFTERRKIFRRLNMRVAGNDEAYESELDRELSRLVRLEKRRGRVAHGFAAETKAGGYFFDAPEALAVFDEQASGELFFEASFSYEEMGRLVAEIDECARELTRLTLTAPSNAGPKTG